MTTRTSGWILAVALGAALANSPAGAAEFSCKGQKFVFFPGGPEGGAFASVVFNGARLAAEHTGCDVDYVWSDWDPAKMVLQFKEAIARRPDGIAIMGHPGEPALANLVDEARAAGIVVTTQNVDLPNVEIKYKADGLGYVGQSLYDAGFNLGRGAVRVCKLRSGDKALVWGLLGQEARGQRTKGVIDAFEKTGVKVEYLEISDTVNKDAAVGIPVFASFAAANPDLKAVVTDHGALTATLGAYMNAAGRGPEGDLRCRLRPLGGDRPGDQGGLRRHRPRPAALPAGLPADRAALPQHHVRLRRHAHRHWRGAHYRG